MLMNNGWVKLHRSIMDHKFYFAEPFTRIQAWYDMIMLANHIEKTLIIRGIQVDIQRGQIGYGLDNLGVRWKWSRGKVERFMKVLEKEKQIVRQKNNVTTLITICNYSDYQDSDKADSKANSKANSKADGQQTVKQTDTNKKEKNDKKEKKEKPVADKSAYQKCISLYNQFIKDKTGSGAKIDGVEGKALNTIISYLRTNLKTETKTDDDIASAFSKILNNYGKWGKFQQKNLKLAGINSNLINIINNIKTMNKKVGLTDNLTNIDYSQKNW